MNNSHLGERRQRKCVLSFGLLNFHFEKNNRKNFHKTCDLETLKLGVLDPKGWTCNKTFDYDLPWRKVVCGSMMSAWLLFQFAMEKGRAWKYDVRLTTSSQADKFKWDSIISALLLSPSVYTQKSWIQSPGKRCWTICRFHWTVHIGLGSILLLRKNPNK